MSGGARGQRVDAAGAVEDRDRSGRGDGRTSSGPRSGPASAGTEASAAPPRRVCGVGASGIGPTAQTRLGAPVPCPSAGRRSASGSAPGVPAAGRVRPRRAGTRPLAQPARGELASRADGYPAGVSLSRESGSAPPRGGRAVLPRSGSEVALRLGRATLATGGSCGASRVLGCRAYPAALTRVGYSGSQMAAPVSKSIGSPNARIGSKAKRSPRSVVILARNPFLSLAGPLPFSRKRSTMTPE